MSNSPDARATVYLLFWRAWLRPMLITVLAMLAFRSAVVDWNFVPTGSMKPTILEWDVVIVNKLAYDFRLPVVGWRLWNWGGPQRGDIVVFDPPGETDRFVKRVVGVPGDLLELRHNHLFVNGAEAEYSLADVEGAWRGLEVIAGHAHSVMLAERAAGKSSFGPLRVPSGHYFVLGDNRDDSADSRYFGFVSRESVAGRVGSVLFSLDPVRDFSPRWGRWGQVLR